LKLYKKSTQKKRGKKLANQEKVYLGFHFGPGGDHLLEVVDNLQRGKKKSAVDRWIMVLVGTEC